jgi:hypothetical protein
MIPAVPYCRAVVRQANAPAMRRKQFPDTNCSTTLARRSDPSFGIMVWCIPMTGTAALISKNPRWSLAMVPGLAVGLAVLDRPAPHVRDRFDEPTALPALNLQFLRHHPVAEAATIEAMS